MGISDRVAARAMGQPVPEEGRVKTAAFPPPQDEEGGAAKRDIPKDHEFNKKALKPLSQALWACSVSQGHALTAYRLLSRLKSVSVSPDGLLGGRGYTMALKDMRKKLHEAAESLSSISDTLYDEATAPHWKPKLAQLDDGDAGDVNRFIEEAEEVRDNPEGESQEEMDKIEEEDNSDLADQQAEKDSSSLPTPDEAQAEAEPKRERNTKTASAKRDLYAKLWSNEPLVDCVIDLHTDLPNSQIKLSNSSVSPAELGGPRIDHRGPGEGDGLYGDYGDDHSVVDPWSADGGGLSRRDDAGEDYDYPNEWENQMTAASSYPDGDPEQAILEHVKEADSSMVPDAVTDDTPTEAYDWGLGFGAKGQGVQHQHPSGEGEGQKGVHGPHSGLPGTPAASSGDVPRESLEPDMMNPRQAVRLAIGLLPQDNAGPPARSDYFEGPKDNMVSVGTSEVPEAPQNVGVDGQDLMNTSYSVEDMDTEYVRYDFDTNTTREPDGDHPGQDHQEPWAPDGEATR